MNSNDKNRFTAADSKKKSGKKINWIMIGSIVILVLSAIIFVLVPALTGFQTTDVNAPVLGSYKGREIKYEQDSDFLTYLNDYATELEKKGYSQSEYMYTALDQAFANTVIHMAVNDMVEDSGYVVPDELVNRAMRTQFVDEDGNFSAKLYNETNKSTIQKIFKKVEEELLFERYYTDFAGSGAASYYGNAAYFNGAKLSSDEAAFVAQINAGKRQFQYVAIKASELPEEEYLVFAQNNPSVFERLDYSICTASSEEEMNEIANLLLNNQITFDDATLQLSSNAYNAENGRLNLYNYQIKEELLADPSEYDDFVALGVGDISTVVHTQKGYALFRRNSETKPADLTDPAVQEVVGAYVRVYEEGYIQDYFLDKAKDFTTEVSRYTDESDTAFTEVAEKMGYEVIEPSAFPCNYGNIDFYTKIPTDTYTELSGIESDKNLLKTLFSLQEGEVSEPFVLGGNIVVFKYKEGIPEDEAVTSSMIYTYPLNVIVYSQQSMSNEFLASPDIKNDIISFYFKYFLGYDF